ncbi:hypothetical protein [Paenibacillus sp. Marseille-Q7038]
MKKRRYTTKLSQKECISFIKDNIDFIRFDFYNESFRGWTKFGIFSISYNDGEHNRRRIVRNKAVGRISVKEGITHVRFRLYKGWTDIFSLMYTMLLFSCMNLFMGPPFISEMFFFSVTLIPAIMVLYSWLYTILSEDGHSNEAILLAYVERIFELEPEMKE